MEGAADDASDAGFSSAVLDVVRRFEERIAGGPLRYVLARAEARLSSKLSGGEDMPREDMPVWGAGCCVFLCGTIVADL